MKTELSKDFPDRRIEYSNHFAQIHSVLLRMLKIFDAICTKYNIDYWVDYGTLLGAVRHKGFIPWDTDIDIGIFYSDYIVFLEKGVKELPADLFFQTKETDIFYKDESILVPAKIRDNLSSGCPVVNPLSHDGINLDFFVYSYDPTKNIFLNNYERIMNSSKTYLEAEELESLEFINFQDMQVPVPLGFDNYLKRCYGNYLELPPVDERKPLTDVYPTKATNFFSNLSSIK